MMVRFIRSRACGESEDDAIDAERRDRVVASAARSERDLFPVVLLLSAAAGGGGGRRWTSSASILYRRKPSLLLSLAHGHLNCTVGVGTMPCLRYLSVTIHTVLP